MKRILVILSIFIGLTPASGQDILLDSTQPSFDSRHKNIYLEALGSSFLGGLHFDMRLKKGRMDGIGFKFGIGGGVFPSFLGVASVRSIPVEINYVLGSKTSSLLMGVGMIDISYNYSVPFLFEVERRNVKGITFHMAFRYQPLADGLFFQIGLNLSSMANDDIDYLPFGISIGYGFK